MSCVPHIFNRDSHCSAATSGRFSSQKVQRYGPSMSKSTIINQDKWSSLHLDLEQKRRQNHTKAIKSKALHGFAHSKLREGQREGTLRDPAFREGADQRIFAYKHRRARAVSEGPRGRRSARRIWILEKVASLVWCFSSGHWAPMWQGWR